MDPIRRLMSVERERQETLRQIQATAQRLSLEAAALARQIREYRGQNNGGKATDA